MVNVYKKTSYRERKKKESPNSGNHRNLKEIVSKIMKDIVSTAISPVSNYLSNREAERKRGLREQREREQREREEEANKNYVDGLVKNNKGYYLETIIEE